MHSEKDNLHSLCKAGQETRPVFCRLCSLPSHAEEQLGIPLCSHILGRPSDGCRGGKEMGKYFGAGLKKKGQRTGSICKQKRGTRETSVLQVCIIIHVRNLLSLRTPINQDVYKDSYGKTSSGNRPRIMGACYMETETAGAVKA